LALVSPWIIRVRCGIMDSIFKEYYLTCPFPLSADVFGFALDMS
jgi:hypothetical protein